MSSALTITRTAGRAFRPDDRNVYFIASNMHHLVAGVKHHDHLLVAVNELSPPDLPVIEEWADAGKSIFVDSGVFNLAMGHARAHNLTMDQALSLDPDKVDGFDALFEKYITIMREYGEKLWGYIEIDQGGRENKIKTRARLEGMGLHPIPVYHPFNDGWDYFDYLAERYDRICFGNVVMASVPVRKRLLATAWERHRKYPHLWIHLLGLTPNQMLNAFPCDSGDSSSWVGAVRWANNYQARCDGVDMGVLPRDWRYALDSVRHDAGYLKADELAAYSCYMNMRNWRAHLAGLGELGCETYPPQHEDSVVERRGGTLGGVREVVQ